jgi:hypothetical protein
VQLDHTLSVARQVTSWLHLDRERRTLEVTN